MGRVLRGNTAVSCHGVFSWFTGRILLKNASGRWSIMGYAASFFQLYEIQYHHFTTLGLTWYPFRVAWLLWLSTWNDPWCWSSSDQVTNPNHQSTCTRPIVSRPVDTKTFRLITPSNRVPTAFPVQREWLVIRIGQLPYAPSVGTNLPFSNRSNQRSYLPTLIQSNLGEWYFISFTVPVVLVTVQLAYNFTWLWVAPHPINSFLPMHMGLHPNFLSHLLQPFSADFQITIRRMTGITCPRRQIASSSIPSNSQIIASSPWYYY